MQLEITEIVDKLVGTYISHGESNIDAKALNNLDEVETLLNHIVTKLIDNANQKDSYEASVKLIGEKSSKILWELFDRDYELK